MDDHCRKGRKFGRKDKNEDQKFRFLPRVAYLVTKTLTP